MEPNMRETNRQERAYEAWLERLGIGYYVYRMFDDEDNLLYVGQTCNIRDRLRKHYLNTDWAKETTRVDQGDPILTLLDARTCEKRAIDTEGPLYNDNPPGKLDGDRGIVQRKQIDHRNKQLGKKVENRINPGEGRNDA